MTTLLPRGVLQSGTLSPAADSSPCLFPLAEENGLAHSSPLSGEGGAEAPVPVSAGPHLETVGTLGGLTKLAPFLMESP